MKADSAFKAKTKRRMRTIHSCEECGKSFRGRSVLQIHLRTHSGEKPFECKSCGKSFRQVAHLTSHMNIACVHKSIETPATSTRTFPCDKCEKVFMYGHVLKQHLRTHSGERPYICDSCGKGFRQISHLNEHRKVVCGNSRLEPGFECSLCKRRFSYKQGLTVHMRIHTGEKPFVCAVCGQMFRQSGNLKIHMKGVHEEKPVKAQDHILCNTCGKVLTGKRAFSQHTKMHTKQKVQSKKNTKCEAEQNILERNPLSVPEVVIVSKSEDDGKPLIKSEPILHHNHNVWNFVIQNQEEQKGVQSGNITDKKEIHKEHSLQGSTLEDESQDIRIDIAAHGKTQKSSLSNVKDDKFEQSPNTYIAVLKPAIIPSSEVSQLVIKTEGNDAKEYPVKTHCIEEGIDSVLTTGQNEKQKHTFEPVKEGLNNVRKNNANGTCLSPTNERAPGEKLDIKNLCTLINNNKYVPVSGNSAAGSFSKQTLAVVDSAESTAGSGCVRSSESVANNETEICCSNGTATTTDFRAENKDTTPKAVNVEVSVTDQESSNIVHVVISDETGLSCSSTSDMTLQNRNAASVNEDRLLVSPDKECLSVCYYDQDTGQLVDTPQYYCSDLDTVHNSRVIPGGSGNADAKHRGLYILAKAAEKEQVPTVTVYIKQDDGSIEVLQGRELSYFTDEHVEQNDVSPSREQHLSESIDSDAVQTVSVGGDGLCHIALTDELTVLKVEVHDEDDCGGDYIVSKGDPVDVLHDHDVLVLKDIKVCDRNVVINTKNSFTDVGLLVEPVHKDANTENNDHCVDESYVAPYIDVHESVLLDLYFTKEILKTLVNISAVETINTIPKEHYLHITTSVELTDDKIKRYRLQLIPAELVEPDGWKVNFHFDGTYMKLSDKQLLDPSLRELLAQQLVDIYQKLQVDQETGSCEVCERTLPNKSMLIKHQESNLEPMTYRCLACKEVGNSVQLFSNQGSKRNLNDLKKNVDNGNSKESRSEDVSCTHFSHGESKKVSFNNKWPALKQRENEKEQHSCVVCEKQFQFSIDCANHTKTHYKVIHPKAKIHPKEMKILKDQKHDIVDDHQHVKSNSYEGTSDDLVSKNPESANKIAESQPATVGAVEQDVNALSIFHDVKDPASDNPHSADELSLCDSVSKNPLFPNPQSENKLSQLQLAAEVSARPADLVSHVNVFNRSKDDLKDLVSQNPQSENKVAHISVAVSTHVNLFNKSVNDLKSVRSLKEIAVPAEHPVPHLNLANKDENMFKGLLSQVTSGSEIKLSQFKTAPAAATVRSVRLVQHVNRLKKPDVLKDVVCESPDPANDVTQDKMADIRSDAHALPHVDSPNIHDDTLKYIVSDNVASKHELFEEVPDAKSTDTEFNISVENFEISGQLDINNRNGIEYIEELCNKSRIEHMGELNIDCSSNDNSDDDVPMTVTKESNHNVEQTSVQSRKNTKCVKRTAKSKNGSQIDNASDSRKKKNSCSKCCKVFKSKHVLKRHMIQHTGFKAFCCERCGRRFYQASHLKSHMYRHKPRKYPCPVCKKSFGSDSELLRHYISMHSSTDASMSPESVNNAPANLEKSECSERDFLNGPVILKKRGLKTYHSRSAVPKQHNCPVCFKMFKSSVGLRHHVLIHQNLKPFQCNLCGKCFRQKCHLVEHGLHHEGNRNVICETCGKTFVYKKSLIAHQRIHTNTRLFACQVCQKSFRQSSHLASHSLTHTREKHHRCDICAKSFKTKSALRSHGLVHTNTRHFSCDECGKLFRQSGGLKTHRLTHNPVKSFECKVCERSFSYAHVLKRHQLLHRNIRPFTCGICRKSFSQAAHLKVHQQIHADARLYECGVCRRRFNTNSSVQTHLVTHVKEKPFSCDECGKTFCSVGSLNLHKRKHVEVYACGACGQVFTTMYVLNRHKCKKTI
ncbi:uncharacterized protein LOC121373348 [Gigantopelta aegis]|uniref:uncharacterized protein LOC121373348 n=1 Tax=Gigantopelta aegis TaxID=1735272 RepID=UPI001B88CEF4|nr:uncharacterized protein LOC121373348 [Gigantopelta aegis]